MTTMIDRHYWWIDGNRLGQWGALGDRVDTRATVEFKTDEAKRAKVYPGLPTGSFNIDVLDYDAPTMDILNSYTDQDELAFMETLNVAAGQKAWLYLVYTMSNAPGAAGGTLLHRVMNFSISGKRAQSLGKNLYPYTTGITAAANGSTITIGALSATQSLFVMQHVEAASATGTFDAKIVSDPAGTPADAKVFTQVADTDVASPANHNSGQFALFNGPKVATDYRYEITAVSAGTWNVQVAVAIVDEL